MPDSNGFLTEKELDEIATHQRGGTMPDKPVTAEEREAQRQGRADREHATAVNKADHKAGVERLKIAKRVILAEIQSGLKRGRTATDSEKKRITSAIVNALGGANVPADVQAGIRRFVDFAADAYLDGESMESRRVFVPAEAAAEAIANADFDLEPPSSVDPLADEMDPTKLAEAIQR